MADIFNIYRFCEPCKGTGTMTSIDTSVSPPITTEIACTLCHGEGKWFWGTMEEQV
jgi:DnaJ-class molecular chaperone